MMLVEMRSEDKSQSQKLQSIDFAVQFEMDGILSSVEPSDKLTYLE